MESLKTQVSDAELVDSLRKAASIWFKKEDILALEELIRRYHAKLSRPPKQ